MKRLRYNVYAEDRVRIWLTLDPKNDLDLTEAYFDYELGEIPEWWSFEHSESGLDVCFNLGNYYSEDGWPEHGKIFGLKNGIAPGQPFLVELDKPHYYRSSYEYEEYDVNYEWGIIEIAPWPRERILRAWDKFLTEERKYRDFMARRRERLEKLRKSRVDKMALRFDIYCACDRTCGDACYGPTGVRYHLVSMASLPGEPEDRWGCNLIYGEDRNGSHEKALQSLIEKTRKQLPHVTEEQIRKMTVMRGGW